jgi:hypothetical protein
LSGSIDSDDVTVGRRWTFLRKYHPASLQNYQYEIPH